MLAARAGASGYYFVGSDFYRVKHNLVVAGGSCFRKYDPKQAIEVFPPDATKIRQLELRRVGRKRAVAEMVLRAAGVVKSEPAMLDPVVASGIVSERFSVNGVELEIPAAVLSARMKVALGSGRYEAREAAQLSKLLKPGDRLLEFGGGVGFISTFAAKQVALDTCVVVEANPKLIPVIAQTHRINGVDGEILHAVGLSPTSRYQSQTTRQGTIPFYLSKDFWGSSLTPKPKGQMVRIPVRDVPELIGAHTPTVIVCDIEGGEMDLLEGSNLRSVRVALFKVHKSVIGLDGINRLTQTLAAQGLYIDPEFTAGAIMTYARA